MLLTTVYTILIVNAPNAGNARAAREYIESHTASVTIYGWCQDGYDNPCSFRAALDTDNVANPLNFRAIALELQNLGLDLSVEFYAG